MEYVYYKVTYLIRWDQLAYLAYGDASYMTNLLDANQELGLYQWLPEGAVVKCPIIEDADINPTANDLPTWKQAA